jgi:hypothetical protein
VITKIKELESFGFACGSIEHGHNMYSGRDKPSHILWSQFMCPRSISSILLLEGHFLTTAERQTACITVARKVQHRRRTISLS